ncbi:TerB family tellurite resistance protein, partial [bacterium]|nr:TerB family tellurite resistance protein [bacterium]
AGAVAADLYLALRAMVRIVLGAGLIHARDSDDLLRDELLKIAAAFCGVATVSKHPLIAGLERAAVSSAAGLPPRTYARLSDLVLPALIARVTHDRLGARTGLAVSMIAGAGLRGAAAYGTMRAFSILALSHIEEIDRLHPWRRHEERARLSKIDVEDLARVVHAVAWADRSFGARERAMIGEILNPLRITGEMKLRVRDWQKSPARLGAVHADRAPLRTRELIYRAAFLVAASDGPVNARETRVLRDAAKKLDLAPPVVEEIHAETVTWFEF